MVQGQYVSRSPFTWGVWWKLFWFPLWWHHASIRHETSQLLTTSKADHPEDFDLVSLVYKFLNNKSTLLKLLPLTENAFDLHLRRVTLATTIDKSAHITKPENPSFTEYGWSLTDGNAVSLASTEPGWPLSLGKAISCSCIKGCQKNCSCVKKAIPCYLWCHCQGLETRCSRMTTWLQLEWIALYHSIIGFRSRQHSTIGTRGKNEPFVGNLNSSSLCH